MLSPAAELTGCGTGAFARRPGLRAWVVLRASVRRAMQFALAGVLAASVANAQAQSLVPEPASIVLLARPGLTDPNFSRTVVLVTRTPGNDTIGVILNRRLPVDALPLPAELAGREVYFGGPLAPRGLLGIGPQPATSGDAGAERDSETGAAGTVAVLPGLQLVVGSRRVRALVAAEATGALGAPGAAGVPARVKVFSGYAGWAPQQLESEIARGGWQVQAASAAIVFDADPDTQWERLTARARAVRAPEEQQRQTLAAYPADQADYKACLVRKYSLRSIERTSISRTSLP